MTRRQISDTRDTNRVTRRRILTRTGTNRKTSKTRPARTDTNRHAASLKFVLGLSVLNSLLDPFRDQVALEQFGTATLSRKSDNQAPLKAVGSVQDSIRPNHLKEQCGDQSPTGLGKSRGPRSSRAKVCMSACARDCIGLCVGGCTQTRRCKCS
jgi:hypothetical protein